MRASLLLSPLTTRVSLEGRWPRGKIFGSFWEQVHSEVRNTALCSGQYKVPNFSVIISHKSPHYIHHDKDYL